MNVLLKNRWPQRSVRRILGTGLLLVCANLQAAAPTVITPVANQTIDEDESTGSLTFRFGDAEDNASDLTVTGVSSNTTLIPNANIVMSGTNATRQVVISPAPNQFGASDISLVVTDTDGESATNTFTVTVVSVNDVPTIELDTPADLTPNEDVPVTYNFTVNDVEDDNATLTLTAVSDDQVVLPNSRIAVTDGASFSILCSPATNENGDVTVTVTVTDSSNAVVTLDLDLEVIPVNDDPVLTGLVAMTIPDDGSGTNLYDAVTVTDVDHNRPNAEDLELTLVFDENLLLGEFDGVSGSSVTFTGTPTQVTSQLQGLLFAPFANRVAVGTTESFTVQMTLEDIADVSVSTNSDVSVLSVNDPPLLTAAVSPAVILDTETVTPFSVSISDPDVGESFQAVMSVSNDPSGRFGTLNPLPATATGNEAAVEGAVEAFTYIPAVNVITGSQDLVFAFSVQDAHGAVSTATASMTVNEVNEAPSIKGIETSLFRTDDATAVTPFAEASFEDPDRNGSEVLTVSVTVDNPLYGAMSDDSEVANVAAATAWLKSLEFVPNANNIPVGQTKVVSLRVTVSDSASNSRYDDQTEIAITGINGAPEFSPVLPDGTIRYVKPTDPRPFDGMVVEDDGTEDLVLRIVLDDANKGELINTTTNAGFSEPIPGTYVFTNSQAVISNLLNGLEYAVNEDYSFAADAPGDTTFSLTATDAQENSGSATVRVILQAELQNFLVTHTDDNRSEGSLRYALQQATAGDCITFALPEYPAVLRLQETNGTITLSRHVTLKGPGADLLRISGDSDGDGAADMQLFDIQATVVMECLTLESGFGVNGGAVTVGDDASLTMKSCVVKDSTAQCWGGAIDVFGGDLHLERCLILSNSTDYALGCGGGGISLYTDRSCSFENTTFAGNRQASSAGYGGGALFVENSNPPTYLTVDVTSCTFAQNSDAAGVVSAVSVNAEKTLFYTKNSIYSDESGRNLFIYGGAEVLSLGGNLCDDSTFVLSSEAGRANSVYLLDHASDVTSSPQINLGPLTESCELMVYPLLPGSAALGQAVDSAVGVDQCGMIRDADPDSGAFDAAASTRLIINEIQSEDDPDDFIELYVPRDSLAVDLTGLELFVDDSLRHVFTNRTVGSGLGLIVADSMLDASGSPVVTPSEAALDLIGQGTIEIRKPDGKVVAQAFFVSAFPNLGSAIKEDASVTLAPQFSGAAYLPSRKVQAPPYGGWDATAGDHSSSTPGQDSVGTPFGSDNADPVAVDDAIELSEDMLTLIPVLANDQDADRNDSVVVTGVPDSPASVSSNSAAYWVHTNAVTGYGDGVVYDPRTSAGLNALPDGIELVDLFSYRVADVGEGAVSSFADAGSGVVVSAAGHGLEDGDSVQIYGTDNYDGLYAVSNAADNTFVIGALYEGDEEAGAWIARSSRGGSAEAVVRVTVIGANDYPVAGADSVECGEEDFLRILADPESGVVFDDSAFDPVPVALASTNLLWNDTDVDTDDDAGSLLVVGVLDEVKAITSYSGTAGAAPVTVHCANHGLSTGEMIVISGYGGHPSYNGEQAVTVLDADSFSIPVLYVDNALAKGEWGRLDDGNRLRAVSALGAEVTLDIRVDRAETHVIYNPRESDVLNAVSLSNSLVDTFYYAVADSHDAISIGQVHVTVSGRNELPEVVADPNSLSELDPFMGTNSLGDVLSDLTVVDAVGGAFGRSDVRVYVDGYSEENSVVLTDVWTVKETEVLSVLCDDLLTNDSDEDSDDVLSVVDAQDSNQGVEVTLLTSNILYNAAASPVMNRLAQGEFAIDFFRAAVSDDHGGFVTNVVAVLVVGVNDTPVSFDDQIELVEDAEPFSFDPRTGTYATTNDYDVDINGVLPDNSLWVLPVERTMTPREGFYTITNDTVTYEPALSTNYLGLPPGTSSNYLDGIPFGESLIDSFEYTVSDQSFVFAENDLFRVEADGTGFVLEVLANDRNFNVRGGELTISDVGIPDRRGSVSISEDGATLTYTPEVNFVGDETFTYTVSDPWGNLDKARVTLRVTTELFNGALQANDDEFSAAFGESVTLKVLANDNTLPETGEALTITRLLTSEEQGHIQLVGNEIRYVQTNDAVTTESFRYEVAGDPDGTARAIADVTVHIIDRTGMLPVQDDRFTLTVDSVEMPLDVTRNDYILPIPRDYKIVSIDSTPLGTVSNDAASGTLLYTAPAGFVGRDVFGYTVSDELGGTGSGRVTVYVGLPTAEPDVFTVPNDGGTIALDVLENDCVLPGSSGSLSLSTTAPAGTNGSVSVSAGQLLFTGNGTAGESLYTYRVSDGTRSVQASVLVQTVEDGVYANADTFRVLADSSAVPLNVLINDSSLPDHRSMSISALGTGSDAPDHGGTVVRSSDNKSLLYTPAAGFVGEESFTYTMTDSQYSNNARVTVKVGSPRFVAGDDYFAVYHEGAATGSFSLQVLLNDVFLPDQGGLLQIVGIGVDENAPNRGGSVEITSDGQSLGYQPDTDYTGSAQYTERFTYEISNGTDLRAEGVVNVTVYPRSEGRLPECNDDAYSVARERAGNVLRVLENDGILPDTASQWTITSAGPTAFGGSVFVSGATVVYSPAPDFVGTDTFEYEINDGLGSTAQALVSVRVGSLLLNEDEFAVVSGTVSNVFDVLLNEGVRPGPAFDVRLDTNTVLGAIGTAWSSTNRLFYTPSSTYAGIYPYEDTVWYGVIDDSGITQTGMVRVTIVEEGADLSTSTITFTVNGVNDEPVLYEFGQRLQMTDKETTNAFPDNIIIDVDEWGVETLSAVLTIDDVDKGRLSNLGLFSEVVPGSYLATGTPAEITAALQALLYTPVADRITVGTTETVRFTLAVSDPFVAEPVTGWMEIEVTPVNDSPVISGTIEGLTVYHEQRINPFPAVEIDEPDDFGLQTLRVQVVLDDASHGILTSPDGVFTALGDGVWSATGITDEQATESLRLLVFEPTTEDRLSPEVLTETTRFTILVDDGGIGPPAPRNPPVSDDVTTVVSRFPLVGDIRMTLADRTNVVEFGSAVGAVRDWVAVGAYESDLTGDFAGAVFLYARNLGGTNAWNEFMTLLPADSSGDDQFGFAVAMGGDTLAVGAPQHQGVGAVYLFERNQGGSNSWGFVQKVQADDGIDGDVFGCSIAIDDDTMAVGDLNKERVYVFERDTGGGNTWILAQKLDAADVGSDRDFGSSIGLHGDSLIVGAPLDDTVNEDTGAAYVFERTAGAWSSEQKFTAPEESYADYFGSSVDVFEDVLVIGSPGDDVVQGAAFIYHYSSGDTNAPWAFLKKLVCPSRRKYDYYGAGVSLDGDLLVVGVSGYKIGNKPDGKAYVYGRHEGGADAWGAIERLDAPVYNKDGNFGAAMALCDYTLAIGSSGGPNTDTVSIYRLKFSDAPVVAVPISQPIAFVDEPFELTVPAGTFMDPDPEDALELSAVVNGGAGSWLSFDAASRTFSGMPAVTGSVDVLLVAVDPDGAGVTNQFIVLVMDADELSLPTFALWKAAQFGGAALDDPDSDRAVWADDADADHDGLSNYAEYVFGTDPTVYGDRAGHEVVVQYGPGVDQVSVSYNRRTDDASLVYVVEVSDDLASGWQDAGALMILEETVPLPGHMERATAVFSGLGTHKFFRIRVY